jgi:hypothetical protein
VEDEDFFLAPLQRGGGSFMRRRALLILASMMLGVLMLGGVALAKEITGTSGSDALEGTKAQTISPVREAATTSTVAVAKTRFVAQMLVSSRAGFSREPRPHSTEIAEGLEKASNERMPRR